VVSPAIPDRFFPLSEVGVAAASSFAPTKSALIINRSGSFYCSSVVRSSSQDHHDIPAVLQRLAQVYSMFAPVFPFDHISNMCMGDLNGCQCFFVWTSKLASWISMIRRSAMPLSWCDAVFVVRVDAGKG
jgi:hypothetical protein